MQRKDHLIKIILRALCEKDRPRSELTNLIKNYEKPDRQRAIEEIVHGGFVEFRPGDQGKGRRPLIGRITQHGRAKLKYLEKSLKDSSVWSV